METVIAIFLLLFVFTIMMALYHRSLNHLTQADRNVRAALFAEDTMAKVRDWASVPANFATAAWTEFSTVTDPAFSGLEIEVTTEPTVLTAPSTFFEDGPAVARPNEMRSSGRLVNIVVKEDGDSVFSLSRLIVEPERAVDSVVVEPVSPVAGTLGVDEEVEFTASLLDPEGVEIEDVSFSWSVLPGSSAGPSGNGTIISTSRDGTTAVFKNRFIRWDGSFIHTGGACRVVATARYWGANHKGISADLRLDQ